MVGTNYLGVACLPVSVAKSVAHAFHVLHACQLEALEPIILPATLSGENWRHILRGYLFPAAFLAPSSSKEILPFISIK